MTEDWKFIRDNLTNYFDICACQRKLKTIVDNLVSIRDKCEARKFDTLTGAEWLLLAIMDSRTNAIEHGINCEYPIIVANDPIWKFIDKVKDNPNLVDN